ncbi:MAG: hypothetical protein ACI35R_15460 [Bacillus sp. (in: firmicutes)]
MNDFLKFNKVAQTYLRELDQYTYEQFTQKPAPDAWSLGEMYNHVIDTGYRQRPKNACTILPTLIRRRQQPA